MRDSLLIILSFLLGIFIVLFNFNIPSFYSADIQSVSNILLYALIFFVGLGAGLDDSFITSLKQLPKKVILLPLFAYIGILIGSVIAFYSVCYLCSYPISFQKILAISSGMGYYTITAVMIDQKWGAELASIALIVNLLRELSTILFAFLYSRYFGKYSSTVVGGATSIDTSMPIIVRVDGYQMFAVAAYCGMFFTIMVPIILSIILSF